MIENTVTVQLPQSTYRKLQKAAELTYRSVDELLDVTVNAALPAPTNLPDDLANELAAMHLLSDAALWAATQPSLSPAEQSRLEQLNHIGGERELTSAETQEQSSLLKSYHRSMLRRAQAFAILAQRGHTLPH